MRPVVAKANLPNQYKKMSKMQKIQIVTKDMVHLGVSLEEASM